MKEISATLFGALFRFKTHLRKIGVPRKPPNEEPLLRSELFSADQMEQHGRRLAASHKLTPGRAPDQLLARLAANETVLTEVCNLLTEAVRANGRIVPAAEWLLDNFYLIEEQIHTAKKHLPKGYSRELPRLAEGPSAGLPRVYDIALETISHGDGRVDPENLSRFVAAYQSVTPLLLGELWAIPIMLRLALIENLRRVAVRIAANRLHRDLAGAWADQMAEAAEKDPKSLILVIADMARSKPPMVSSFVAELTRRLQGRGAALALPLTWMEQFLSESHLTIQQLVQAETQQQATDQVSIGNSIGGLRSLGGMNWPEFVETMSRVEQTLREDPAGVYSKMDFATRDRYRHVVEKIARSAPFSEDDVARRAVLFAQEGAAVNGETHRKAHVGFYLIDQGRSQLEQAVDIQRPVSEALRKSSGRAPLLLFLGSIFAMTALFTGGLLWKANADGLEGEALALVGLLSLFCTSHLAVALVNWLTTLLATPHALPRMDFSGGIPPESRTLAVVPTLLTSPQNLGELVEALEVRYLANHDPHLHFGLLTDFPDAVEETLPEDAPLLRLAQIRIDALNEKYGRSEGDPFFLFHRPRRWNPQERIWMGYERKRGKLADLNSLLRGGSRDPFSLIVGDTDILLKVKYVITLDTDTELPRDSARELAGAMAHPLNRPQYDEKKQRVTAGYGLLQPRVAASLPGSNASLYARLCGSDAGIDPYTRAVSDVYQDLFGEGSFIGKGIYDVDAFEKAFNGRFPENRILSHDLLEGCYIRSGLLSDVQIYEAYPPRYSADMNRRYRWIRGDWQIAGWLLPRVPGPGKRRQKNPLSPLSLWKLFDNLRRSLVSPAVTLLLLLGWTVLPSPWFWTGSVIGMILIPLLIPSMLDLLQKPSDALWSQHLSIAIDSTGGRLSHAALTLIGLPYEAFFSLDAILRTTWRIGFSHRRLLEWNPSSEANRNDRADLAASFRSMWIAPVISLGAAFFLAFSNPAALLPAAPILLLWLVSPAITEWISRPLVRRETGLTPDQILFLRRISRKTWAFFETFVGPEDHWLPPDNYQEYRGPAVAHRTSPTNIGLALLANLSAYDFGYLPAGALLDRTGKTLRTLEEMERYEGHWYNWYDTQSLKPLHPRYVSTVDSGNLACHLLTLRPGLLALSDQPILGPRAFEGLRDTLRVLAGADGAAPPAPLASFQTELDAAIESPPATLTGARNCLERLTAEATRFADRFDAASETEPERWARLLASQCAALLDDLTFLTPWTSLAIPAEGTDFSETAGIPSLRNLAAAEERWLPEIEQRLGIAVNSGESERLKELRPRIAEGSRRAQERLAEIERLALLAGEFAQMKYNFLFDKERRLLAIGYNVSDRRRDASYYDLLASEARLCAFLAIAQGHLPQESWFALGRLLTSSAGEPILLSWSGSMFEYLMPLLVMPTYENTLLDQTCHAAVHRQIEYGRQRGVPWGISESGYNMVDGHFNYQYRAFGVPGLGLKRGLAEDLVIAPYASVLALMVAPEAACLNLQRMAVEGFEGKFGFYEAIDYTPSRLRSRERRSIVRSFMAHHQGMSLLSLASLLLDRPMQKRFETDPLFQATLLLLQERIPRATAFYSHGSERSDLLTTAAAPETPVRVLNTPNTPMPEVQLLSNGRYHLMVTNAGGGYSRWKDLAVTRWREDTTCDNWGTFCYLRDTATGAFWSNTYQPTQKEPERYEAIFSEGRAEFRRRDHDFDTHTEIVVSPEDDIELRRIHITNRSRKQKTIDVTSYSEVVLAPVDSDALHPAFSNLFVQTEIIDHQQAILCTRRPRSAGEQAPWMFHLMAVHDGEKLGEISYETDRMQFIGRGNSTTAPLALSGTATLSGSQGSVLDPIAAIRQCIRLDPERSVTLDMVSGIGDSRDAALRLVEKYQDRRMADRVFDLAWTHSQVVLRQLNADEADAQLYARLANSILYAHSYLRAEPSVLIKNRRGQSGLWGYAISGDLPIVLLQIGNAEHIDLVRRLVQAHAYWRLKGLAVDLVIWNEDHAGYRQLLQEQMMGLIASGIEANVIDRPGGIFVRPADQISNEDRVLLQSVARVIITDSGGTLAEQINRRSPAEGRAPILIPTRKHRLPRPSDDLPHRDLILSNGLGGFTPDGSKYVITTGRGKATPAPWVNVLANPHFGTVLSENGMSYTWSKNAHEFRLTPWQNDPVSDSSGEALYLRDEESGHFWSPTPLPSPGTGQYISQHGFGYSVFEHQEDGLSSELTVYVALDRSIKFSVLRVRNQSGRPRRLSATGYIEWVLGDLRSKSAMHLLTEVEPNTGVFIARNRYNTEFPDQIAFFDVDDMPRTFSGDRTEFIGRNGTLRSPAAMTRARLSGKVGAGLDPCAAIQVPFELADGQEQEIIFRLGVGRDATDAGNLARRFRGSTAAHTALEAVHRHWEQTLGVVQVETPDPALNVLANGWLLYQTIACRLWARSGYYQSGGAFGFRDQLQDTMALIHAEPRLLREQLLLCASRQFPEGDVQHWWHPPLGRGVRTHCSDDFLWLPLAACRYVLSIGETGVLDESIPFIEGRPVNVDEDSYYDLPIRSQETTSLYDHCVRAIVRGLRFGEHGLPLIGSGDWNDGMNAVGEQGKGESIWLGFFLYDLLNQFTQVARIRDDLPFAERCQKEAAQLRINLEQHGWDGEWYRRAYFDDGTPLGSAKNPECQIDSISQSWSVLSGAGEAKRARMAMEAVNQRLVRPDHALIQLLDPPFDTSSLDPGYIKGYVPGVRENGGQYTHAAIWTVMAFAKQGDHRRAWELLKMINPVNHARSAEGMATYKVEPYVVAADVYAVSPHAGRGGWTWYTGSAGWMYRLIIESLLGLKLEVDKLYFTPCLPPDGEAFKVRYRYRSTPYHITFLQTVSATVQKIEEMSVTVDGIAQPEKMVSLVDDRQEHAVEVHIRRRADPFQSDGEIPARR
ncbi:MAG: glucoamylase family protein [Candidatus Manganitrophaceae bacterium]